MADAPESPELSSPGAGRWLAWLAGAAALAAVIVLVLHVSDERAFVATAMRTKPAWLLAALLLQVATYFAEGAVWRRVAAAAAFTLSWARAAALSVTKLFVDQALPTAGLSGTLVLAKSLEQRGMTRASVAAGVIIDAVSYYAVYVACLLAGLLISILHDEANALIVIASVVFAVFALGLVLALLVIGGRTPGRLQRRLQRFTPLRLLLGYLHDADPHLARSPRLLLIASLMQLTLFLLDATTLWLLIISLGSTAPWLGVFASFMIATLFRTIGVLPGGLGTFEATSVLSLHLLGLDVSTALAATLLFRGLSFWLPMLPGMWFSRAALRRRTQPATTAPLEHYWSLDGASVCARLNGDANGLSSEDAARRLAHDGRNELESHRRLSHLRSLANQLRSPLLLLLLFAAVISLATGQWTDASIVLAIVAATVGIGYRREYQAEAAAQALRHQIKTRSRVLRDGRATEVMLEDLVVGDVVLLAAGSLVPADLVVLEAKDCYVSEAALTGESFPVEKQPAPVAADAPLAKRSNCLFMGTNVRSGTARAVIVATGRATQIGSIAQRLLLRPPETEFDRGLRRFGYLLTSAMLIMVLLVFAAHMLRGRPPVETLLFAIALAVGLSPELLPAILSVNLSRGAAAMAKQGVLVRRLNAIENLGSMDVLCTDKTGTLTAGVIELDGAFAGDGSRSSAVLEMAAINAALETGLPSPLDDAIQRAHPVEPSTLHKRAEIPFDFVRKRVSVVVEGPAGVQLLSKGAYHHVLAVCSHGHDGPLDEPARARLERRYEDWSARGIRVLGVASRELDDRPSYSRDDEVGLRFEGFLTFVDRAKPGVSETLAALAELGVAVKLITGDNRLVAAHVAGEVGLRVARTLTGAELEQMNDEALWREAERTDVFAEVDPNQKERIILALKRTRHVVGFLGDGVNDAPAMHAADTSVSVDQAVDVAREAADFVLLERDLAVIRRGIEEGRKTFANTLKYILTTTSANLGNMVSMALASLVLPFLPLLAGQILLNNFLSDIPAIGIADDSVDAELVAQPRRWEMRFIARFMLVFGLLSSAFDFLTFAVLLRSFDADAELFRTGWFVESLLTELAIALVVRTRRPFFRSRPGRVLLWSTQVLVVITFVLPYLPATKLLGFVPPPAGLMAALAGIVVLYVGATELTKRWFYRRELASARA